LVIRAASWTAHLYYFSSQTLGKLLESCGYEVRMVRSFGKIFSLGYWASRLKGYPAFVSGPVRQAIKAFGAEEKIFYLNTRDSLEIMARKR
jgi:hypothetical protein